MAVEGTYFDFASQKEHSSTRILGALFKEFVGGLKEVSDKPKIGIVSLN